MELKPFTTALATAAALALSTPLWAADSSQADPSARDSQSQVDEMDSQARDEGDSLSEDGMSGASEEGEAWSDEASSESQSAAAINPADYDGKNIVTADGESVGKVSQVVIRNADQSAHVVASVGGFLGMGATEAAIPISQLSLQEDELVLSPEITKDSLQAGMKYEEAEFSAFEATSDPAASDQESESGLENERDAEDESLTQ